MTTRCRAVRLLAVGFLGVVLSGCQNFQKIIHQNLIGFNGDPLIQPQMGNCTLDSLEAREEGFRAAGGVGGLAVPYAGQPEPAPVVLPKSAAERLAGIQVLDRPERNAAVVVLDDFSGIFGLGAPLFELTGADLATDAPGGPVAKLEGFVDDMVDNGELSHGALVMNHVIALLEGLGATLESAESAEAKFRLGQAQVVIRGVDIEDFRTDRIADRLRAALEDLYRDGYEHVAVNMSFSIVPCSVLRDYRDSPYRSFDVYVRELAKRPGFAFLEEQLLGIATTPIPGDPLLALTESEVGGQPTVIYVASAGNYALDYPLAPALWENVIGVSSAEAGSDTRSGFSNRAEVMADGAWFRLIDGADRHDGLDVAEALVYAGTSFAAPSVAVYSAIDLASAAPRCGLAPGTLRPRLASPYRTDRPLGSVVAHRCATP